MEATIILPLRDYEELKEENKQLAEGRNIVSIYSVYGNHKTIEYLKDSQVNKIFIDENQSLRMENTTLRNELREKDIILEKQKEYFNMLEARKWYQLIF